MIDQYQWLRAKEPIWVHKNSHFVKAIVQSINKQLVSCIDQNGEVLQAKKNSIFQRNPFQQQYDESRRDLMDLDISNQPEILQTLKKRFDNRQIHSFVESTLLVINPYYLIKQQYTSQKKHFYLKQMIDNHQNMRDFSPHIYSITATMINELLTTRTSQAIVISGQSGSGKTQANKECLRFINYYYESLGQNHQQNTVQKAIILSNPILQAFGNSKTIRNNNSSRFGKYLSISIDQKNKIKHAQFYNYLLEKSRIISRANNQQNFHIFYEFIEKLPLQDKLKYNMINSDNKPFSFSHFNYLKTNDKSQVLYQSHPDISFENVASSIKMLPNSSSYDFVCRILSAVLHLGNLEPYQDQTEGKIYSIVDYCSIIPQNLFKQISQLLMIDQKQFFTSLTSYHIKIGGEHLNKYFGNREVQELIHSLAKTLYEKLFNWLIQELNELSSNKKLAQQKNHNIKQKSQESEYKQLTLGFLDIYGFQVLQNNSLEQLFINYTNERLHQIYLSKIFKQQKNYFQQEGLITKYRSCEFQDNIKVIELIDYQALGIFNLLDEWCSVASPDQSSFITKLRYNHKKHQRFPPSNFNLPSTLFVIKHTPKDIDYSVVGFRDKNKDLLRGQIKIALKNSKLKSLSEIFSQKEEQNDMKSQKVKKFLSSKFRKEMNQLMEDLKKSELHFIRCIKSNNFKKPNMIQDQMVYNQICYLGILDTIKIKKIGYCNKLSYEIVDKRFKWLVRYHFQKPAFNTQIKKSIQSFVPRFTNDEILYGKNKVFFKDFAYTTLVKKYNLYLQDLKLKCHKLIGVFIKNVYLKKKQRKRKAIKCIQRYIKPILQEKQYKNVFSSINRIQKVVRDFIQLRRVKNRIQNVKIVQSYIKRMIQTKKRTKVLNSLQKITRVMRRAVLRKKIQAKLVLNKLLEQLLSNSIQKIREIKMKKIKKYIMSFKMQNQKRSEIAIANLNLFHVMQQKNINILQNYFSSFSRYIKHQKYIETVIKGQNVIRSWIIRKNFLKLKKAAIIIQKAWRQYYFRRKGSKELFNETYKFYFQKLKNQNLGIKSFLFRSQQNKKEDTIQILYKNYLSKFKQKFSIMFYIIDFQAFIDMDLCFPDNSWLINYFQILKDGFDKDNPIQKVQVSETFCLAISTNKLYVWGMNQKYDSTQTFVQQKPKNQIQFASIVKDSIELKYQQSQQIEVNKQKIQQTINKKYIHELNTGKLTEFTQNKKMKIIKMPQNDRIAQIACGSGHVVLRSTSKKIYTFGSGKQGQLGHGSFGSLQNPKQVYFPQTMKNYHPIQISASFNSTIVLFNNKKIFWFGKNGTINTSHPQMLDLKSKSDYLSNSEVIPIKIHSSWSRTYSIIGITVVSYNGRMEKNISLRNKVLDILIQKWHQKGIQRINPPYVQSISDHFEECHVKLPKLKVKIQPQSKKKLRQMENKVKSYQTEKYAEFSFSQHINKN